MSSVRGDLVTLKVISRLLTKPALAIKFIIIKLYKLIVYCKQLMLIPKQIFII